MTSRTTVINFPPTPQLNYTLSWLDTTMTPRNEFTAGPIFLTSKLHLQRISASPHMQHSCLPTAWSQTRTHLDQRPTHVIIPLIKTSFQLSTTLTSIVQRVFPVYINPQDPTESLTRIISAVRGETPTTSHFAVLNADRFSHTHQLSQTTTKHHFAHLPIRISTDTGLSHIVHRQQQQ